MNFDFSEPQKQLSEQVAKALARHCPMSEVRRSAEAGAAFSTAAWNALVLLGVPGAAIGEEYGGSGLGYLELCTVAEQIGYALAPVPFLGSAVLATTALEQFGSLEQKARWLPRMAEGAAIGCLADCEGPGELIAARIDTRYAAGRLSGQKAAVVDGASAQFAIVLAKSGGDADEDCALYLVELDQPGVVRAPIASIDPAVPLVRLGLDGARAEPLEAGAGWQTFEYLQDIGAIHAAFEALGGAEAALARSLAYAKERRAFGRPIASYQAIKHRLAQVYARIQLARSNAYYAAWAAQSGDASLPGAAACALLAATDAFSFAAQENNQVHGGVSFTWEADCHFYYKRSRALASRFGGRLRWKERLVDALLADTRPDAKHTVETPRPSPEAGGREASMSFEDTPGEAAFRAEVRVWLERHAPRRVPGEPSVLDGLGRDAQLEAARAWQGEKAQAGYAGITLPERWGGRGGTAMQSVIYAQEEARFDVPAPIYRTITLSLCIPTVIAYGREADAERRVAAALRGDEIWCQLFSEPAAGSDLAGVRTRAVRHGDGWLVNGQKIWTSSAQDADYGLLIARTDASVPKHDGLTCFYVDMKAPGVEVRPIRQMNGEAEFNEVFFTDVFVPDHCRLSAEGQGWRVAITTLMHERMAGAEAEPLVDITSMIALAGSIRWRTGHAIDDLRVRERIADWQVVSQGLKYTTYRALTRLSRGEEPGPEFSIGKLLNAAQMQAMAGFALELADRAGAATDQGPAALAKAADAWLRSVAARIAGGTDEILLNIVAERVLGMPKEPDTDRNRPFNEAWI